MKGIMFRDDMLKAIEEGRKTVTRRKFKEQPPKNSALKKICIAKARYHKDEIVYIKEPYDIRTLSFAGGVGSYCPPYSMHIVYKAVEPNAPNAKWRNKMFMPTKYARNYALIIDVRPRLLLDIGKTEAKLEGFNSREGFIACWCDMYGKDSWERDKGDWVWRIEFKPIPTEIIRKVVK